MFTTSPSQVRELDHRYTDGIDVRLLWDQGTGNVSVSVQDGRSGESFELPVDAADALDAFRHPFAYANSRAAVRALAA
jgi:hypothetical protein